jgi:hypothetical protein
MRRYYSSDRRLRRRTVKQRVVEAGTDRQYRREQTITTFYIIQKKVKEVPDHHGRDAPDISTNKAFPDQV